MFTEKGDILMFVSYTFCHDWFKYWERSRLYIFSNFFPKDCNMPCYIPYHGFW